MNFKQKIKYLNAKDIRLEYNDTTGLILHSRKRRLKNIKIILAQPLMKPLDYASVISEKTNKEIAVIKNLKDLDSNSSLALKRFLNNYYITPKILKINSLSHQLGAVFWDTVTDKGKRQFVIWGITESVRFLTPDRILITDVNGNRFEIESISKLDVKSRHLIELIL